MEPFNIDPNVAAASTEPEYFSLDDSGPTVQVSSPETLEKRSRKIKYGADDIVKLSQEEIYKGLADGQENDMRESAAMEVDRRRRLSAENAIVRLANAKGGPLSEDEAEGMRAIVGKLRQKTDPASVFEEAYAQKVFGILDLETHKDPNNPYNEANKLDPDKVAELVVSHSDMVAKREYINKVVEDLEDQAKDQSWIGWGADQAKSLIPLYNDIKMRGNVPGVSVFEGVSLGSNLEEQRRALLRLPLSELKAQLKIITEGLAKNNPSQAVEYAKTLLGMSADDKFLQSISLPLDVASIPGTKLAGRGIKAMIGGKTEAQAFNDAKKAVTDISKAAADPNASPSTMAAASGNLNEAATIQATTNAVAEAKGVVQPGKKALDNLPSTFRTDLEEIKANPGRSSRELLQRIEEQSETVTTSLNKAVETVQKVNRLPDVMANETAVKAIIQETADRYPWLANTILDTSKPYLEPVANTWHIDMYLGRPGGEYFKNRQVAENFIKMQGLPDAKVIEGTSVENSPAMIRKNKLEKIIASVERDVASYTQRAADEALPMKKREYFAEQAKLLPENLPKLQDELASLNAQLDSMAGHKVGASVEQQGLGYYIKITKPIDETGDAVRQAIAQTKNTQQPNTMLTAWIGHLRTPEEVLSVADLQARKTATYSPSVFAQIMKDNAKDIRKISTGRFSRGRKRWEEFQRVLSESQFLQDPDSPGDLGYFFKNPLELETFYQRNLKRFPDEDEVAAYFAFKRGMEMDRTFRNIAEQRNKMRVGGENHRVFSYDEKGNKVESEFFTGVAQKYFPRGDDNVLIMGEKMGEEKIKNLKTLSKDERAAYDEMVKKGELKVVEVYAPEHNPLEGFGDKIVDNRIRYVVSRDLETKQLDWNHVPRRGGGHIEYDHDFYIKQPRIRSDLVGSKHWYEGDVTVLPVSIHKLGVNVANHLNEVRKLIAAGNMDEAMKYSNKNLHIDWDVVSGWFEEKYVNGKKQPGMLALDQDIRVVPKGKSIIDLDKSIERRYENFKDGTRSGSLSKQYQVAFTSERDADRVMQVVDKGTKNNPLYALEPAKTVDPISSMNRALTRITNSNFMDDYKIMSVEHWLKNASDLLELSDSEIKYASFSAFANAQFKKGALIEYPERVRQLKIAKRQIEQLIGTPSDTDALLHSAAQKLADSIYSTFGPRAIILEPTWALPLLKDPFKAIRSMVFHMKLGLFNIPQFVVQANNYANIMGIAGYKYAAPGTMGAQLHFWSTVNRNPEILAKLDDYATKLNLPGSSKWRPGEFKEAWETLERTGFGNTGGEYAALDNLASNKIIPNSVDKFLESGQFFFKQGERNAKYGAWYTAFKEFRDKNPVGRLTQDDIAQILQRADLLNINMSRASSSSIHQGWASIPTQFYTYQLRLLELFMGKRLTGVEKARMFATNAAFYGIPMAGGLTGLPIADHVRKYALESGFGGTTEAYTPGASGTAYTALMEGLPAAIGSMVTGGGDISKGTVYNFGDRFGTKGFDFINSVMRNDKTVWDIFGGAAFGSIAGMWKSGDGFRSAVASMFTGDNQHFPMTVEDVTDMAREISSVNSAARLYLAIDTGRWVSKKDAYISDTSTSNAVFAALTGLQDTNINDLQRKLWSNADMKEKEKIATDRFMQEFRRGVLAQKDDPEQAKKYFTRAQAALVFVPEEQHKIIYKRAVSDNESMIDRVNWDFYLNTKNIPAAQRSAREEAMRKIQKQKDN